MNVSRRFALLFILASLLMSTLVSFVLYFYGRYAEHHLQMIAILVVVIALIGITGMLFYYQRALSRANMNLDEAQQLTGLGSWERDLVTGKGYWSANHYRLLNIPQRRQAPGMDEFFEMIHAEDREQVRETVMEAIRSHGSYEIRYRLEGDAGNRIFLSRGKVLLEEDGKPVTLVGTIQDVTHKHRRDQFRESLLKQKDLFISRLGHDLKTPLTPLVALLPLIRSRTEDTRQQELLDLCIQNVSTMKELVAKTLQLARLTSSDDVTAGRLNVQLSVVVDAVIARMSGTTGSHLVITHTISPEIIVRGNRAELEELFTELFRNAARFSPPGSRVSVEASYENRMVTAVVQDTGIGLLPDEVGQVFDDFYMADPSRHAFDSFGLGLTICRRIVENHGGRISASSPGRDQGTAISFTLEAGGSV